MAAGRREAPDRGGCVLLKPVRFLPRFLVKEGKRTGIDPYQAVSPLTIDTIDKPLTRQAMKGIQWFI